MTQICCKGQHKEYLHLPKGAFGQLIGRARDVETVFETAQRSDCSRNHQLPVLETTPDLVCTNHNRTFKLSVPHAPSYPYILPLIPSAARTPAAPSAPTNRPNATPAAGSAHSARLPHPALASAPMRVEKSGGRVR